MFKRTAWKNAVKKISLIMATALVLSGMNGITSYAAPIKAEQELEPVEETVEVAETEAGEEETDDAVAETEADAEDSTDAAAEAETETADDVASEKVTEDKDETVNKEKIEWNVYVYMFGGESESKYGIASENIKEILNAKASDDVRVLLQAGGAKQWHLEDCDLDIDADRTQRFVISDGSSECVYDEKLTDMAEMNSLYDFLAWGAEEFPSERSMIILYGEGKGFCGLGTDELYGDALTVNDIENAFEKASVHADVLAFDAGYMADLDIMNVMAPYADFMVASEGMMTDEGLDYTGIVDAIADNSGCKSTYLAKNICDSYFEASIDAGEDYETLSAVDLSKIDAVVDATGEYIDALTKLYNAEEENTALLLMAIYDKRDYADKRERDLRNLADLSTQVLELIGSELTDEFTSAQQDIEEAVINSVYYRIQGKNSRTNTGIALAYCFDSAKNVICLYEKMTAFPAYVALLDSLKYDYHPDSSLYDATSKNHEAKREFFSPSLTLEGNKDGFATLVVNRGKSGISSLDYNITETDDVGRVYTLSERSDLDILSDDGKYLTKFDGRCSTIEGEPVVLVLDREEESGAYFNVPVSVCNEDGEYEDRYLYVYYDATEQEDDAEESERYTILGMHKNSLRNLSAETYDIDPVENGTKMRAAYPKDSGHDYKYGNEFIFNDDSDISLDSLKDGEYKLQYFVKTGLGKVAKSVSQTFYMKDGEIYMSDPDASEEENAEEPAYDESVYEKETLPIVTYKEFYGIDLPERLRDIHYDAADEAVEEKTEDAIEESEDAIEESEGADSEEATDETTEETNFESAESIDKADVTMLLYICGSDLERAGNGGGSDTLKKAAAITESDRVNIIAQTGGTPEWAYNGLNGDAIQRFEAHEGTLVEVTNTPVYNMATGTAFSEFLNWGINNYPAEHYVVYIYDHGGAWAGTTWDYNFDSSNLSMKDWTYALDSTGVVFDDIIFDVCLMATVEVASAIAPYAKYMTAYEESQMSGPYEWERVFSYLINHSDKFDPVSFGKYIVDINADIWEEAFEGILFQTMALIDLSKINALNEAISDYAKELNDILDDPGSFTRLIADMEKSRHYAYDQQKDIVDLMNHSEGVSLKVRQNVINAVDDAVVYKRTQFDQLRNNGLTIYFDTRYNSYYNGIYADIYPVTGYVKFLDRATSKWHGREGLYGDETVQSIDVSDYKVEYEIINENNNVNGIKIIDNEEAIYNKSYQILQYDEEQGTYYGLAKRSDFTKGTDGKYYENFDGRVASIDGTPCYMKFDSFDGERLLYKIPASVWGTSVSICVAFYPEDESDFESFDANPQNGKYEILGIALDSNSLDVPEKNAEIIPYGCPVYILLPEFSKDGEQLYDVVSGVVTYSEDMKLQFTDLDDGEYVLRYTIENGLMKTDISEDVPIVIKDGRIQSVGKKD